MLAMKVNAQYDFNTTQSHLHDLNRWLVGLLGDDYAIALDEPADFNLNGETFIRYPIRCIFYTHNEKHYDETPHSWVAVSQKGGRLISGCWVCKRPQVIKHDGKYQPTKTLLTLSHNDPHLLKVLVAFGCKEVEKGGEKKQPAVAFPVTYADGSDGFHYRVALEGKNKWLHKEGGKAGEAVFALHRQGIQEGIKKKRFVIITESPLDALVLIAAGNPAISVLGKGNAEALACDLHRETLLNLLGDDGMIFVWVEPDAAEFPQKVANALQRPVKVITPPVPEEDPKVWKDAKRLWVNYCGKDWEKFKAVINELLQNATEVVTPQPEPVYEPKIVRVRRPFEEAVWRPLGEITMPQNDRWQVEGLIKEGNLVILSARPKTAKSIVALNLAACVAMGKPFLDRSVTQGRALFVAYERHDLTLERALAMGLADCYDFMLWDKVAYGLPLVDCLDGWVDFIERNGVKLVVIDTLAHFLKPELAKVRNAINAYDHIYNVMGMIKSAAEETGCTFVLIHHDRKGETAETDEARVLGTTALTASPDAVFQLKSMSDKVICLKATGNAIEDTALYFKVGEDFWIELVDKPATTKEEKAAWEIEDFLRQHGEATRQDLIRLLVEKGLAKASSAPMLLQRAIDDYLHFRLEKRIEGKHAIYRLKDESNRPSLPPADNPQETRPVTGKENVIVVIRQPDPPEPTSNMCNMSNTNNNEYHVTGVTGQPEPDLQPDRRITTITSAICVMGLSNNPQGSPPDQPAQSEPDLQVNPTDPLWLDFDGVLPELVVESPPDQSGLAACVEGNCVVVATSDWVDDSVMVISSDEIPPEPEDSGLAGCQSGFAPPELPANEPEPDLEPAGSPPDQPVTEPICPYCGIELEPEPDSGLAVCVGCGRVFEVENDDEDNYPPDSPDDGGDNPPNPPNNGNGKSQTGFAPPITRANPPAFPTQHRIYSNKFNLPAILNRMTERLPDGSIKLVWQDRKKTEIVAPNELAGWQPIEEIPAINLPDIESVEIPPVVVLDIETTDLDPKRGRILAVGLALFIEGKEVEAQIFRSDDGEANLLARVFDWLRETCDGLGEIILTGYNLLDFDLPYMIERARRLEVECPFRYLKNENGEIVRRRVAATEGTLKGDPLDYPAIVARDLPITLIDTQHLVCRWDYSAKALRDYDLKSVAAYFGFNQPDRPILSPAQIRQAFQHDPATFNAYLLADLRETYALFAKLIPPYIGIAALTRLPLDLVAVKSTAWIWQQILERYYTEIPQPDEKRKYEGGLVVSRKGLWSPCLRLDIASLYPTIMLAYRIHSRKDTNQFALRWLKTLTQQRLALKAKAKAGDTNAQIVQEAMKVLINSLYGFYGTGGYPFNDMTAAAKVTEIGRKVLTCMVAAIEDAGGIVVEADTDGIIICYRNTDPQEILEAVTEAIPEVFKVEVEWQEAVVFVSDDKNYVVLDRNGDLIAVKGSKWRGRDKEAYLTQAIPTFVRIWATEGKEAALNYAKQVLSEIRSGNGWRWVVRTHRVGRGDKFLINAGFEVGEIATYAYKDKKHKIVAKYKTESYDCKYYAGEFSKLVKEVIAAIDPAQIEAWERMVASEARPLIFVTN